MDMGGLVQRSMQTVQTNMASQMTQSSQSTQKAILDVESKLSANLREVSQQQTQQREMLAQLTSSVHDLASMVQSMKEENGRLLGQAPQQNAQARLNNAKKAKSPRLLHRHGMNGGAWYGPHCREIFERALSQNKGPSSKT